MKLFDVIQGNNRFVCEAIEYKGVAYLRINKMYLDKKHPIENDDGSITIPWAFTPQTVMMNSEAAEQYIVAIQSIDVMDILIDMEKLEKDNK